MAQIMTDAFPRQTNSFAVAARPHSGRKDDISEGAVVVTFDQASKLVLESLPSKSSWRPYRNTFKQWQQFATSQNFDAMDLYCDKVRSFLYSRSLSRNTRISRKSHMLKLLHAVSSRDARFAQHYMQLREYRIQRTAKDNPPQRKARVISRKERRRLLSVWQGDDTHKGIRNCAVIRLLLYTAIHTTELTALRWEDLDWDAQTLSVFRGSDGQRESVPIFDASRNTINALRRLEAAQKSVLSHGDAPYTWLLPALSTGRSACFRPGKDAGASTQTIRSIVSQTARKAGLGKLTARDLRNTSLDMRTRAGASDTEIQSLADKQSNE